MGIQGGGQMSPAALKVLAVALLVAMVVRGAEVEQLDDVEGGVVVHQTATKLWAKNGKVPPTTTFYKTMKGFEHHGKCRFACYQDSTCGGYSWTWGTHTCKLFRAPDFLKTPFSNDKWHKHAAKITGKKYKKDQATGKAKGALKKGLKKVKKSKPSKKHAPAVNGHVHLGLQKIMNVALKRDAKAGKGKKPSKKEFALSVKKGKLYTEFMQKYKHEYTKRAERLIAKRAHRLADKRVKKLNKKHKGKVKKHDALAMYKQSKKQVEGHAIRQMQRRFKKHLKDWTNAKLFAKSERMVSKKKKKMLKKKAVKIAKKKIKAKKVKKLANKALKKLKKKAAKGKKAPKSKKKQIKKTLKKAKKKAKKVRKKKKKKSAKKRL